MELFKKFTETIFLKENSNLEKQILDLQKLLEKNPQDEKAKKDLKLLEYGLQGEKDIIFELKHANIGMYVLHDINIKYEDMTAQIDYVIVTKGYIYLVECKNLYGNITVNSEGQFQREYELNGKKYKEAIYSPYTQAMRHIDVLKKIWLATNSKFKTFFLSNNFDRWYQPLVVLANDKSILNIKYAPQKLKEKIIRVDELVNHIKKDISKIDSSYYTSQKRMLEMASGFLKLNETFENENKEIEVNKEEIEEKLKSFRKEKAKTMNVPAYYIFTDEEMRKIIELMPSTPDELANAKILPNVKMNLHGSEIIEILNNRK